MLENTMSDLEKHHIGFGQEKRRNPLIWIVISGLRMLPKFWFEPKSLQLRSGLCLGRLLP